MWEGILGVSDQNAIPQSVPAVVWMGPDNGGHMAKTRITATVDFAATGRQVGHLSVPHSTDASAWGAIEVPIAVIANGSGPTVVFTGGNHGDEYEGPIALLKLIADLDPGEVSGRVIILPALNLPAVRAARRLSPIDGLNMNRIFPGHHDGTITSAIAHYITSEILPLADVVVDIHSGGKTLDFVPSAIIHNLPDPDHMAACMGALQAFAAPVGLILMELDSEGMLDTTVERLGKTFLSTELGGGGTARVETVAIADRGVRNVLKHFGVLAGEPDVPTPTRLMETPDGAFVSARDSGLYEPLKELGDAVAKGEPIGRIHFIETPDREPLTHVAGVDGMVFCRGVPGLVAKGDCLAVIAQPYSDT